MKLWKINGSLGDRQKIVIFYLLKGSIHRVGLDCQAYLKISPNIGQKPTAAKNLFRFASPESWRSPFTPPHFSNQVTDRVLVVLGNDRRRLACAG
jgi:hypothetical protein